MISVITILDYDLKYKYVQVNHWQKFQLLFYCEQKNNLSYLLVVIQQKWPTPPC